MARQEKMVPKKKGRPAIGQGTQIQVRLQPELLEPLDSWIAEQPEPRPSRPEAVRFALRDWLIGIGLISIKSDKSGA